MGFPRLMTKDVERDGKTLTFQEVAKGIGHEKRLLADGYTDPMKKEADNAVQEEKRPETSKEVSKRKRRTKAEILADENNSKRTD